MTLAPHQQQKWTRTGWGNPCGMCAPTPAVVHYDTQASHHGFSLPVEMTHTSLKTGRAFGLGIFSQFLFGPLRSLAVPPVGAGVMDSSIRHPRCKSRLSLCRLSHSLRDKALEFTFRRISHDLQNLSDALHTHVYALSCAAEPSEVQHARKVLGNVRKAVGRIRNV